MLVIGAALARVLFGKRDRLWSALVIPALSPSPWRSATRATPESAPAPRPHCCCCSRTAGATGPAADRRGDLLLLAPTAIADRVAASIFSLKNPTNRDRIAMLREGAHMIARSPARRHRVRTWCCRVRGVSRRPDAVQPVNPPPPQRRRSPAERAYRRWRRGCGSSSSLVAGLTEAVRDPIAALSPPRASSAVVGDACRRDVRLNFGTPSS